MQSEQDQKIKRQIGYQWDNSLIFFKKTIIEGELISEIANEFQKSARAQPREVRLENWDKSTKKMNDGGGGGTFFSFRSNFGAITRLETLATQATSSKTSQTFGHLILI